MKINAVLIGVLLLSSVATPVLAAAGNGLEEPEGIFSVTPVLERTCLAVQVPINAVQALAGVRWYNNDGGLAFPAFLVASGFNDTPPIFEEAVVVAEIIAGVTMGWSEVQFEEPIASQTEALYLILQLPAFAERISDGAEGGPGLGYRTTEAGGCVFLSPDGNEWVRLNTQCRVLVEPILIPREAGMMALAAPRLETGNPPPAIPWKTELRGAYPNPFNPLTHIEFTMAQTGKARLDLFDLRGRLVCRLCDEIVPEGRHVVEWRGRDDAGREVSSGVYLVRMRAGTLRQAKRILLLR